MSIPLEDLGGEVVARRPGDFRRKGGPDGAPYVSDPDGGTVKKGERKGLPKLVSYGRPSAFGKAIESSYNLLKWKERQLAWGLVTGRGVTDIDDAVTELAKLAYDADDKTWRAAADKVVKRAYDHAKSSLAAQRGTHGHAITEDNDEGRDWIARVQDGEDIGLPAHVQAALVAAWQKMLDETGMVILATELPIVHDEWKQAGTLDRIVLLTRDLTFVTAEGEVITVAAGTVLVLDIKTGKLYLDGNVVRFWKGYAVQCCVYNDGIPYDTETDQRRTWPEALGNAANDLGYHDIDLSNRWAIIAHLPIAEALAGRAVCRLIAVDLDAGRGAAETVLRAKAWEDRSDVFHLAPSHVYTVDVIDPAVDDDPFGQLPKIDDKPFTPKPAPQRIVPVTVTPEHELNGGEGPLDVTEDAKAKLKERLSALLERSPVAFTLLQSIYTAAQQESPSTHGIGMKVPSRRRAFIQRALLALAEEYRDELEDDHLRCVGLVIPDACQIAMPIHRALLALTCAEAERFHRIAVAACTGEIALSYPDETSVVWLAHDVNALAANPAA